MKKVLCIGDGDRESVSLPELVRKLLSIEVDTEFQAWHRLHDTGGRGYRRKLKYAVIVSARSSRSDAVVAVVDRDTDQNDGKLRELRETRNEIKLSEEGHVQVAIGEAIPHFEVWLLDDPVAVRLSLALERSHSITDSRNCSSPKSELDKLISQSEISCHPVSETLGQIARQLDIGRCIHADTNGLRDFAEDCKRELTIK